MSKNIYRILALVLVLVMMFSLTACGKDKKEEKADPVETEEVETEATEGEEEEAAQPTEEPPAPAESKEPEVVLQDVTLYDGTSDATITFHTNGTYDYAGNGYYITKSQTGLSDLEWAGYKIALDNIGIPVATFNGEPALGPWPTRISGDSWSNTGNGISIGSQGIAVKDEVNDTGWVLTNTSSTSTGDGCIYISISGLGGPGGSLKLNTANFTMTREQAACLGITI